MCKDCITEKDLRNYVQKVINELNFTGVPGRDGTAFAVKTTDLPATVNCPNGLIRLEIGIDQDFDNSPEVIIRTIDICKGSVLVNQNPFVIFNPEDVLNLEFVGQQNIALQILTNSFPVFTLTIGQAIRIKVVALYTEDTQYVNDTYKMALSIGNYLAVNSSNIGTPDGTGYGVGANTIYDLEVRRIGALNVLITGQIQVVDSATNLPLFTRQLANVTQAMIGDDLTITTLVNSSDVSIVTRTIEYIQNTV